jgi:hypothetical protein
LSSSRRRSQARLWLFILCAVAIAAVLANVLIALASPSRPTNSEYRPARLIPNTDVNLFGANMFLHREVEEWKLRKTLEMASEAGIGWIKQQFPWEEIEPVEKGQFFDERIRRSSWEKYDLIVDLCEEYGIQIIARLDRPPSWTREDNSYKERPPDDFQDYGDFVYAFVERYKGHIRYIQIWNEPNIFPEWGNRPVDPAGYVGLVKVAYESAKRADPNVYVLSAPLAITLGQVHPEPGKWISMNEIQFLEEMYTAGAKGYFDILSANAFGLGSPPEEPASPNVLNFRRVLLLREVMERSGDGGKPIWFNEFGWNASPADFPDDQLIWERVSEEQQAQYTVEAVEYARENWPWAGVFNIWFFRQVGNIPPDRSDYYFRMVDVDFTPRLVYYAVKEATRVYEEPAVPGYYQESNPAIDLKGDWTAIIDPEASAAALALTEDPTSAVSFTFVGHDVDLIAEVGPDGGRMAVSLDGHALDDLPTNGEGLSYIDLFSPVRRCQHRIRLVREADDGIHTLTLEALERSNLASEGTSIRIDALEVTRGEHAYTTHGIAALLGLALVAAGGLSFREWSSLRRR